MRLNGEERIEAAPARVWAALNDVDVLKRCLPGCESLEAVDAATYAAVATLKVGPMKARFRGKLALSDVDPPLGYRLRGEAQGGAAGFADGTASVRLVPDSEGTRLTYQVEATVGGKMAQVGARLLDATARKVADGFFKEFAAAIADSAPETSEPIAVGTAPKVPPRSRRAMWTAIGLGTAVVLIYALMLLL